MRRSIARCIFCWVQERCLGIVRGSKWYPSRRQGEFRASTIALQDSDWLMQLWCQSLGRERSILWKWEHDLIGWKSKFSRSNEAYWNASLAFERRCLRMTSIFWSIQRNDSEVHQVLMKFRDVSRESTLRENVTHPCCLGNFSIVEGTGWWRISCQIRISVSCLFYFCKFKIKKDLLSVLE